MPWIPETFARFKLVAFFSDAPAHDSLVGDQGLCATGPLSAAHNSDCDDKGCFCADRQFMSDKTEKCATWMNVRKEPLQVYNGVMVFYGNECGFQPMLKEVLSQSIVYPAVTTESATATGIGSPTVTPTDSPSEAEPSDSDSGHAVKEV
ncbi:hypothetical protein QBC34DRAFT_378994 [Podospora aff. communis PSN243]|uniref:Extracellular membrane protein CFEM domain-containing protein n=1 Tax=Podospora aff. communis PSN243 TaxID=3040156 RepID=A0AAV9GR67_9PEZI|nr:hypothetical protein QBC34DRAFT_378994 [Podospora aff. communis PSN243]